MCKNDVCKLWRNSDIDCKLNILIFLKIGKWHYDFFENFIRLKSLFERLDPSGKDGQYIFTSHAPYFIDLFDSCLDGIWVVRSQKTHSLLERPARSKLEANLGQYSLGEMHFRGLMQ